jgi:hypothetical protein
MKLPSKKGKKNIEKEIVSICNSNIRDEKGELAPGGHLVPQKGISLTSSFFPYEIAFKEREKKHRKRNS